MQLAQLSSTKKTKSEYKLDANKNMLKVMILQNRKNNNDTSVHKNCK